MSASTRLLITTLIVIAACGAATAQELNISGAGARAEGMAGAFIGVADDATALVWNPAGIATLERPEASVVTRYVDNSWSYTSSPSGFGDADGGDSHGVMNFVSGAYPLTVGDKNLVVAAAYQRQIDLYAEAPGSSSSGGVDSFTPGFGLRLTPTLSVGAAANIWFGTLEETTEADYSYLDEDESWNHDFSGLNANLGLLFDMGGLSKPVPLRIGACLRTPFTLEDEGSAVFSESGELTFTREWDMPLMVGVGASYRFGENLTVASDFETRMFGDSMYRYTGDLDGVEVSGEEYLSDHREDLNEFRIGAEYLIVLSGSVVPVRLGYRTAPTLMSDYDDDDVSTGQVVGSSVSVGSGIILDKMSFDAAFTYTTIDQADGSAADFETTQMIGTASAIFYF